MQDINEVLKHYQYSEDCELTKHQFLCFDGSEAFTLTFFGLDAYVVSSSAKLSSLDTFLERSDFIKLKKNTNTP